MKDAFKKKLSLGDRILYATKGGPNVMYIIGTVTKLYPCKKVKEDVMYTPPDRVGITMEKANVPIIRSKNSVNSIVYASNVILISKLD